MKTSYYTELKKQSRYYYAGGWEIQVTWEEYPDFRTGKVIGHENVRTFRSMSKAARADLRRSMAMDKRIAQAVNTKEEYNALWKRIDPEDWDFIIENNLTGDNLRSWAYNTRTADEYYKLLRYN